MDKIKISSAIGLVAASIAAFYLLSDLPVIARYGIVIVSVLVALFIGLTSRPGRSAWEFMGSARTEIRKVIWPERREVAQMTGVVIVMVFLVGLMIYLMDWVLVKVIYEMILGV